MPEPLTLRWVPSQADFDAFARISGDDNPIHMDPGFSARTRFGRTVSHGMLIYSKFWGLLRNAHPQARQFSQSMMFPNPSFTEEPLVLDITFPAATSARFRATREATGEEVFLGEAEVAL
ncbi:MaoC/PaaZ C-terminal domain-containing protein [Pseudoruegeria sp. SHC-113]|uniref:MaoC/PaaZ C-terminal domain-containing protein n=1 Tax=Pseudoruegeria sp. SHC-113 TaxID=2855439 RepID=UPI0021BB31EB|nr:MaoC/PaaZ C-terminal domain-containing protein [Pseudoruegeria sp. SHC-113]MCT8160702.1 hydratase [Pseudoruegeria sp. SHC-113]